MSKKPSISSRKKDHLRINLEEDVSSGLTTGLENYRFRHQALPEVNLKDVDLSLTLYDKKIKAPVLISSMTGGAEEAGRINRNLAAAAQEMSIPLGVGSQRAALQNPDLQSSFQIRDTAPDILLFANLGAVQFNYRLGVEDCRRAVEMIEADALILHLNPLQEALQPEGDTNWKGILDGISEVCSSLEVPVIAKEVGWGISARAAKQLWEAGVTAVDVAGAGGTSWSEVEMHRARTESQRRIASTFINWGIPTAESINLVKSAVPDLQIFASGGLRSGVDLAKCLALGATLGGMAGPFLQAANHSAESVVEAIQVIKKELEITLFAAGAENLQELAKIELISTGMHR
ncbi:MAG: type 2 isopentenyl-diphosphate Delta-isomerase [Anaerolineales bacterium]|nr:type 2 isopentenyl-diphosphate Delta-isomerase [Anaerolineales bacterium]